MSGGAEIKKDFYTESDVMERLQKDDAKLHELVHYQQRFNWDCGLSCCLMVLSNKDRNFILNNLNCFIEEEGFGESTWTIDLCYILNRFRVKFTYTTITLGVDPGYIKENFYDKVLAKDSGRVNSRFENANTKGITICEKTVTLNEILHHLSENGPVIVLTNANLLSCSRCSNYISCYPSCFSSVSYQEELIRVFQRFLVCIFQNFEGFLPQLFKDFATFFINCIRKFISNGKENAYHDSYQGHYIVLVGFDQKAKEVLYRNPTVKDKVCGMPFETFEEARTSYGTDEDIIFVFS